jgi:hypothetical protein
LHNKQTAASPRVKLHSLIIQELHEFEGGSGVTAYYSKGHHNKVAFIGEVLAYVLEPNHPGFNIDRAPDLVKHEWWRCVPVNVSGEWQTLIQPAKPHTHGSFPVTTLPV